jgi:hypothetical protein
MRLMFPHVITRAVHGFVRLYEPVNKRPALYVRVHAW